MLVKRKIEKNLDFSRMNSHQIKKFQCELLKILKEIDRICKKHDIKYSLSSGTLLGAVRHKGFIPWDDDADVVMLREDYEKFCKVCKEELNADEFFWQTQDTDENYTWVYGKLRLKNTACVRRGQEQLKQINGIFVDVFPVDNFRGGYIKRRFFKWVCTKCRKAIWAKSGDYSDLNIIKRFEYNQLRKIPLDKIMKIFNTFAKRHDNEETENVISYNFDHTNIWAYGLKKSWFNSTSLIAFEGEEFQVIDEYERFLKGAYGDYMTLPPEEERVGNADPSYVKFSDGEEIFL